MKIQSRANLLKYLVIFLLRLGFLWFLYRNCNKYQKLLLFKTLLKFIYTNYFKHCWFLEGRSKILLSVHFVFLNDKLIHLSNLNITQSAEKDKEYMANVSAMVLFYRAATSSCVSRKSGPHNPAFSTHHPMIPKLYVMAWRQDMMNQRLLVEVTWKQTE